MATIKEEFELLKAKILAGKEHETIHIVYTDQERARKKTNKPDKVGKQQTRFTINCDAPEVFSELYAEYDRILVACGNKTVALSLIIAWLRKLDDARIQKKMNEGSEELPSWLK